VQSLNNQNVMIESIKNQADMLEAIRKTQKRFIDQSGFGDGHPSQ
jgi:hypothetical protein